MCSPGVSARDRVLAELAGLGPGTADPLALLDQVRDLAGFIDRAQGELARLTGALDAVGGAAEGGYSSTAAFRRRGCGRAPGRAGELVATGRGLRRLLGTGKALMAGEVSFDAAHAICRAAGQLGDDAAAGAVEEQLLAVVPATAQPPYRAGHGPPPPMVNGPLPASISGTAVWHEPGDEPPGLLGLGYPALDPEDVAQPADGGAGCVRLPYLSLGSAVQVRNECADRAAVLPVTSCSASARQFCDRCVKCGTSPRARVADLTMAAFVELGGNLEDGCFNATLTLAG